MATPKPRPTTTLLILLAIYAASVAVHIALLWKPSKFPFFASDAVQYALTGENLRTGRGYTLRGHFNDSAPPLYPAFVALGHSLGPADPHGAMLVLSTGVMILGAFPVYGLAMLLGTRQRDALLLAAAASMLPHTFYAAIYMAESLQYPLYLTAFYLAMAWLNHANRRQAIWLGLTMGLMLLNKWQAAQFILPFFAIAGIAYIAAARREPLHAAVLSRQIGLMAVITGGMCLLWIGFKAIHSGSALGMYGNGLSSGLPLWSSSLAIAYASDFLLAPGLITVVPLLLWAVATIRKHRLQVLFAVAVLLTQLILVSTIDGGITGWLRERLFLYCFPIMAVLAVRGTDYIATWRRWVLLAIAPIVLIGGLMMYAFAVPTALETPWAFALGSLGDPDLSFARSGLIVCATGAIAIFSAVLFFLRKAASTTLAAGILVFHAATFVVLTQQMDRSSAPPMTVLPPIRNWLSSYGIVPGSKLFVAGRHNYFEPNHRGCVLDSTALEINWRFGLPESTLWAIETLGRYDVRMVQNTAELATMKPGDYLFTIVQARGLDLVGVHYPYSLYRVPPGVNWGKTNLAYSVFMPRSMFAINTATGAVQVTGPSTYIPAGSYKLSLRSNTPPPATPLRVKVVNDAVVTMADESAISFQTDGLTPFNLRISGPAGSDLSFQGINLTPVF